MDGQILGKVVGATGFLAGEVGGVVLTQKWLAVDGYQWLDCVGAEVGVAGELAALPGVGFAACIGITVKIDVVHGVFH